MSTGLGGIVDGTLRTAGVFSEQGLVSLPENLNFMQGATLTCAGVTAWNALYGLRPLKAGEVVLTQGTGGVSLFALQFAKAAGATVIATTSSAEKVEKLKKLGADHIINYKETANWGEKAKELTGGKGVHHVIEVGGAKTMVQSLAAVRQEGIISIIGFVGGEADAKEPGFLDCLRRGCTVRGILIGSRDQFEDMVSISKFVFCRVKLTRVRMLQS
jgi:NADPH:quinone reductase-like Zn-dependent oxidoreductase